MLGNLVGVVHTMLPAAAALAAGSGVDLTGSILQSAGAGTAIIVVLLLTGVISPKSYTERVEAESAKWYEAWEASRKEVDELRRALAVQTERTDAAVATAQRNTELLEQFSRRMPDVASPHTPTQIRPSRRRPGDSPGEAR